VARDERPVTRNRRPLSETCESSCTQIIARQNEAVVTATAGKSAAIGVPMNGAVLGPIDISIRKAKTAVLFGMNSEAVGYGEGAKS